MASLPYPCSQNNTPTEFTEHTEQTGREYSPTDFTDLHRYLLPQNSRNKEQTGREYSPTDFTDLHRWLGCVVGSHRIHRIHRSLLLRRNSHRELSGGALETSASPGRRKFIAEKEFPQNSQNTQKFITEKKLPQIAQIHTDVTLGGAAVSAAPTKPDGTIILTVGVSQNLTNADSASL